MTDEKEPFNPLEKWFLLNALQTHRAGAEASWVWLRQKWDGFGPVGRVTITRYTASCTGSLSRAAQLKEVEEFGKGVEVSNSR